VRDENGKAVAVREPIIHSFNKGETVVHALPIYNEIKARKNIILLGDSSGDVHMADGFDYENIIRIWFLNHDSPENRKLFQEKFDVIILNDGPMDEVNKILQNILST
jgi:5'-nucleotidase